MESFFNELEDGEVWTDNDFVAFASNKISIHTRDHLTRCLTDCGAVVLSQIKRPTYKQYQSGHSGLFPLRKMLTVILPTKKVFGVRII